MPNTFNRIYIFRHAFFNITIKQTCCVKERRHRQLPQARSRQRHHNPHLLVRNQMWNQHLHNHQQRPCLRIESDKKLLKKSLIKTLLIMLKTKKLIPMSQHLLLTSRNKIKAQPQNPSNLKRRAKNQAPIESKKERRQQASLSKSQSRKTLPKLM